MMRSPLPITLRIFFLFVATALVSPAQMTPQQAIEKMTRGFNMGRSLELPNEGDAGGRFIQEYYFDDIKQAGFNFVRVPIQWDQHTGTTAPYTINSQWLDRVQQVVEWGLSRDLIVIINSHHDRWILENSAFTANDKARFEAIWRQVADRFQAHSDKLLFEIANEPALGATVVDQLNAAVMPIIRRTNPTRIVVYGGPGTQLTRLKGAVIPPGDNYLMGSFHTYVPAAFAISGTGTWGTAAEIKVISDLLDDAAAWSKQTGIPVLLGEFGTVGKADRPSRELFIATHVKEAARTGIAPCIWHDFGDFSIYTPTNSPATRWSYVKDVIMTSSSANPAETGAPRITTAPASQTRAIGMIAAFNVEVEGAGPFSYQWLFDGADLTGETNSRLVLGDLELTHAGAYSVRVTSTAGTVTSTPATLTVNPPGTARLVNLSARGRSQNGDPMIVGYVAAGGSLDVLVRAVGPSIGVPPFNVSGVLADPVLTLYDEKSAPLISNDDWSASLAPTMSRLGAFPLPANSLDAAIIATVPSLPRTCVVSSKSESGVVLAEAYDASISPGSARLVNLSTRVRVASGDAVLITGFVIAGDGLLQVLIRGAGPTLAAAPFNLTDTLRDPILRVYGSGSQVPLYSNNNWTELMPEAISLASARTGGFTLTAGSRDSALLLTLPAGAYSAIVSGIAGDGTALAEIYVVQR